MIKSAEFSGKTEEEAINAAVKELSVERDKLSITVLERAKSGFLGIGASPAKIKVEYEFEEPKTTQVENFLSGLFDRMGVDAVPEAVQNEDGSIDVQLKGENLGTLIGRRGETLDAIQHLTNYSINRAAEKRVRINVDAEGYRKKREESLERLANKIAGKVVKYRRNFTLEPMNSYERHVIHSALQNYEGVTTYSTGTEPNRRVVVAYDRTGRISSGNSREWY